MHRLALLLAALASLIVAVVLVQAVVGFRWGPLALVSVFEPHLLLLALVGSGLAAAVLLRSGGRRWPWIGLAVVAIVGVVGLTGEVVSFGGTRVASASTFTVLTWNLELGSKGPGIAVLGIVAIDADVVALQELDPATAAAIDADPTLRRRYPYRLLKPDPSVDGLGLLAKLPLEEVARDSDPLILHARLHLTTTDAVDVFDVHPYPPQLRTVGRVPVAMNTLARDKDLAMIGALVTTVDVGRAIVAGDLNTAPTEPGFDQLRLTLADAHEVAGTGFGFTWRPSSLEGLGLGLLRIDHVLSGASLRPVQTSTDCSLPGDHCRLVVTLDLTEPAR